MNFDIATLSRTAGRTANEDYADFLQTDAVGCWVIADGLGGHRGGATASKAVVEAALDSFRMTPDVSTEAVTTHIARAQEALLEAQRREPALSQMRSTIVVLISGDREAVWGHVGDSRLYHLRGGQVIARTRDHSVGQALVDGGQIDAAAQGSHEDRSRLLRCLGKEDEGDRDGWRPAAAGARRRVPAVHRRLLGSARRRGDDARSRRPRKMPRRWLDRLEARLRRRIGPSHDNYTATAIRVLNARDAASGAARSARAGRRGGTRRRSGCAGGGSRGGSHGAARDAQGTAGRTADRVAARDAAPAGHARLARRAWRSPRRACCLRSHSSPPACGSAHVISAWVRSLMLAGRPSRPRKDRAARIRRARSEARPEAVRNREARTDRKTAMPRSRKPPSQIAGTARPSDA